MLPILQVGPLALPIPGLVIIAGFWLGLDFTARNAFRFSVNPNHLYNLILLMGVSGIVGGRITYAIRYWDIFSTNLYSLLSRDLSMFDISGGMALAIIAGIIYGQRRQMALLPTLDSFTPFLAVMGVTIALAHLAAGSAFGTPADLPWSLSLWGARRHPSQIYELIAATGILILTWPNHSPLRNHKPGMYFLAFLAMTSGARLFLEGFRGDSQVIIYGIRSAQIISWFILASSLIGMLYITRKAKPGDPGENNSDPEGTLSSL
jgi:phosphatidylglycerol:prolipoprotein diacylglycerol transferase